MPIEKPNQIDITPASAAFKGFETLRVLLMESFAFMEGRIDPPSSLHNLDAAGLALKAKDEVLLLAHSGDVLVGCVYLKPQKDCLYLGKMAVAIQARGQGVARRFVDWAEDEAKVRALPCLRLETRIELVENHAIFCALGFVETARTAHEGFDQTTGVVFEKAL